MKGETVFQLESYLDSEEYFHLSKNKISQKTKIEYHRHNYFELFWVIDGACIHCLNGQRVTLKAGDLVFMRTDDTHSFEFKSSKEYLLIYNLAFFSKDIAWLKQRYFPDINRFFWSVGLHPTIHRLNKIHLKNLSDQADQFLDAPRTLFFLDRLLLYVFEILYFTNISEDTAPYWLQYAVKLFGSGATENGYKEGAAGFLKICERSNAHVNRTIRKHYGANLTQFVNRLRITRAKEILSTTNKSVKEISYELGFNDVNYFHKLFKASYGMSPNVFRKKNTLVF